jgi:hypothetical protein
MIAGEFAEAGRAKARRPAPFSLRLSADERARLERAAAGAPLAAYIKAVLFTSDNPPAGHAARLTIARTVDRRLMARALALIGAQRLSNNLNQLARAANTGSLDVRPNTEGQLQEACAQVRQMRDALMRSLGLRPPPTR